MILIRYNKAVGRGAAERGGRMKDAGLFVFTLLAYFVKAVTGFGDTLVMSALFSFLVPNTLTTPVNLLLSLPANAAVVYRERRSLSLRIVGPLSLMLLAGDIPGAFLLARLPARPVKSILGVVIVALAVWMIARRQAKSPAKPHPLLTLTVGVLSGLLCGLFGIGALLAAYLGRVTDDKSRFRGNLCCIFLLENLVRFVVYLLTGLLNIKVLLLTLLVLPASAIGLFAGMKADRRLDDRTVRAATLILLLVSGLFLTVQNLPPLP